MAKGTNKAYYRWVVGKAGVGGLIGATIEQGGYEAGSDASVPPPEGFLIASHSQARSQCSAAISRAQSRGIDAGGRVYFRVQGQDADNPVLVFDDSGIVHGQEVMVDKLDTIEHGIMRRISLSNREQSDDEAIPASQLGQEV